MPSHMSEVNLNIVCNKSDEIIIIKHIVVQCCVDCVFPYVLSSGLMMMMLQLSNKHECSPSGWNSNGHDVICIT